MVTRSHPLNRDHLKSDHDARIGINPAARQDQYGSRHNRDEGKLAQRRAGKPSGKQDLSFRESAQDLRANGERKNKKPGRRFKPKLAKKAARRAR